MQWWISILPLARHNASSISYQGQRATFGEEGVVDPDTTDEVMLVRKRETHIYYNKKYFDFVENCRQVGIMVPIIPGIKPITAKGQATVLPTIFHIDLPEELSDEVEKCKDNVAVKQVGIEWAVRQSRELMKFGVPTLHFYSMGKSDPIYKIAKQLF